MPVTAAPSAPTTGLVDYWGLRNGWQEVSTTRTVQIPLAASVPYSR